MGTPNGEYPSISGQDISPSPRVFLQGNGKAYESLVQMVRALIDGSPLKRQIGNRNRYTSEREEITRGVTAHVLTSVPYERLAPMRNWPNVLRMLFEYQIESAVNGFLRREDISKPVPGSRAHKGLL